MEFFRKKSYRSQILFFSAAFIIATAVVAVMIVVLGSRHSFNQSTCARLAQLVQMKSLEFESGLNSQIALVMQMTKSPAVLDFMVHPYDDRIRDGAVREFASFQDSFLSNSVFWVSDTDKMFYSDCRPAYIVNPLEPEQYWYSMTLECGKPYNFNINYNSELKKTNLWINAVVNSGDGHPAGICGTGIPLDGFFDSLYEDIEPDVSMYFFNHLGEVTGTTDKRILEKKVSVTELLPELDGVSAGGIEDRISFVTSGGVFEIRSVPTVGWYLVAYKPYTAGEMLSGILPVISLVLVLMAVFIITVFNLFLSRILGSMSAVMAKTKDDASSQAGIVGKVRKSVSANLGSIRILGDLLFEQTSAIEESEKHISSLLEQIRVLDSSRADSIQSASDLRESSGKGAEHLSELDAKIGALSECAERLHYANDFISNVTEQTALVSINAAIEAAHAGEHGAGFAVVAKEIRNLAEKSQEHEEEVSDVIGEITGMVQEMRKYALVVKDSFERIVESGSLVSRNFSRMAEAIESQNSLGHTIGDNLSGITESVRKTAAQFSAMKEENESVSDEMTRVSRNAGALLDSAESVMEKIR
ncbi:methyl-accepting chemotaxis protein [Treponema saccharophilum]|uniref:Methyl-accepting chemotaxis sensory transducer n=2 Tax=Treponema saccharophilum TaxID=165 RepID=H7EMW3_9SPIR|nr:methyl-accepting chemotaxis protein [Treponema saccharophilum]EIC01027.1 methyl-accepting chemotaxis sensory transducer [Treponema saccharophilum DSM 2985]BDC95339.1 hypothetical protein TRSA_04380 [Treponema saccharophilum]